MKVNLNVISSDSTEEESYKAVATALNALFKGRGEDEIESRFEILVSDLCQERGWTADFRNGKSALELIVSTTPHIPAHTAKLNSQEEAMSEGPSFG